MLTWKFVEASKASVLYIYIDNRKDSRYQPPIKIQINVDVPAHLHSSSSIYNNACLSLIKSFSLKVLKIVLKLFPYPLRKGPNDFFFFFLII